MLRGALRMGPVCPGWMSSNDHPVSSFVTRKSSFCLFFHAACSSSSRRETSAGSTN